MYEVVTVDFCFALCSDPPLASFLRYLFLSLSYILHTTQGSRLIYKAVISYSWFVIVCVVSETTAFGGSSDNSSQIHQICCRRAEYCGLDMWISFVPGFSLVDCWRISPQINSFHHHRLTKPTTTSQLCHFISPVLPLKKNLKWLYSYQIPSLKWLLCYTSEENPTKINGIRRTTRNG
jgi:hypothetical protein